MSVMCANEAQMLDVLKRIKSDPRLQVARLKNMFIPSEMDAVHFRRLMLNVGPVLSNGEVFIGECQIHIRDIFKFKKARSDLMHTPYEYFRTRFGGKYGEKVTEWIDMKEKMTVLRAATKTRYCCRCW